MSFNRTYFHRSIAISHTPYDLTSVGAPDPVADRARWGGARAALDSSTERALDDDVDARPVADRAEGVASGGSEDGILHNDGQLESAREENVDGAELFGSSRFFLNNTCSVFELTMPICCRCRS